MDKPNLTEKYEAQLQALFNRMHNDGIPYETVHFVAENAVKNLETQATAENYLVTGCESLENGLNQG